jgi:hypothetical protein
VIAAPVGQPRVVLGRTGPDRARHSNRARQTGLLCAWAAHTCFGPLASLELKIPFLLCLGLNSNLNL